MHKFMCNDRSKIGCPHSFIVVFTQNSEQCCGVSPEIGGFLIIKFQQDNQDVSSSTGIWVIRSSKTFKWMAIDLRNCILWSIYEFPIFCSILVAWSVTRLQIDFIADLFCKSSISYLLSMIFSCHIISRWLFFHMCIFLCNNHLFRINGGESRMSI